MVQVKRPLLKDLNLTLGKRTRLHRILYEHEVGNGMALILPIDHGLEHGPRDFFANPESVDPAYQLKLAKRGRFFSHSLSHWRAPVTRKLCHKQHLKKRIY